MNNLLSPWAPLPMHRVTPISSMQEPGKETPTVCLALACSDQVMEARSGRSFSRKTLSEPAIFDIAVDPKNAEHLSVGTTEGLFESADGGITWRQIKLETPTQIWDPIPAWDISINPCRC